jgi:DNA-entry nuclease
MKKQFIGLFAVTLFLTGCGSSQSEINETTALTNSGVVSKTENVANTEAEEQGTGWGYEADVFTETLATDTSRTVDVSDIDLTDTSELYIIQNGNVPYFTDEDKTRALSEVWEDYSELDELGRCGVAYANLCTELRPTEERGEIGSVKPTGWHTVKYSGVVDGNYLYNRCHLIAFMLAGENANPKNLITGTRYFNVVGMLEYESKTDDYMDANPDNHVLYRVTPVFDGENLVADGVLMEGYSVEDNGALSFCVFVKNIQPSITIDYATGESWLDGETTAAETSVESASGAEKEEQVDFILNTSSKKYHLPSCSAVEKMNEDNKETYNGTISWLKENGYEPCGICKPQ